MDAIQRGTEKHIVRKGMSPSSIAPNVGFRTRTLRGRRFRAAIFSVDALQVDASAALPFDERR